jgi:serine/threonine protein kinase
MYAALKGEITMFLAVSLRSLTRIIAHEAAYEAGILHRDISAGNILIVGKEELNSEDLNIEGGMLIDWDLSKIVHPEDNTARQFTRTVS